MTEHLVELVDNALEELEAYGRAGGASSDELWRSVESLQALRTSLSAPQGPAGQSEREEPEAP